MITHQEMVLIQYYWFRDLFFTTKVSEIYNNIYDRNLHMNKQQKNSKEENNLLYASCQHDPQEVALIQDLLALQKTKTLMIKKRGLQADLENRIEQFVEEKYQ